MSGLGHYLEDEGIPTVSIALVREHAEAIRPPRALWVPFELGRPFGVPGDAAFQTGVVRAALALLESGDGPVLLGDYPIDASAGPTADGTGWVCPIDLSPPRDAEASDLAAAAIAEIDKLEPWYALALETRGRTTFGIAGRGVRELARFAVAFAETQPDNPDPDVPLSEHLKLAVEDLRAWYTEAITARPGGAGSRELSDWFWGETRIGAALLAVGRRLGDGDDETLARVATLFLVPRAQHHRL